jgi:cold shock CspA family protein
VAGTRQEGAKVALAQQPVPRARELGKVESFDKEAGLGQLRSERGALYPFHCTQLSDGSREIAVGTRVYFVIWPGHRGSWEARSVEPASG